VDPGLKNNAINIDKIIIEQITNKEYILETLNATPFKNSFFDDRVELGVLETYASKTIIDQLKARKSDNVNYICGTCNLDLGILKSICCNSCLMWYHFKCVGIRGIPKTKMWFCIDCYNKNVKTYYCVKLLNFELLTN
jgi:hypothetical protein